MNTNNKINIPFAYEADSFICYAESTNNPAHYVFLAPKNVNKEDVLAALKFYVSALESELDKNDFDNKNTRVQS